MMQTQANSDLHDAFRKTMFVKEVKQLQNRQTEMRNMLIYGRLDMAGKIKLEEAIDL